MRSIGNFARDKIRIWRRRTRQRSELLSLSAPELQEVMISASDVEAEEEKLFWTRVRIPDRRHKLI